MSASVAEWMRADALWRARNKELRRRGEDAMQRGDELRAWLAFLGYMREEEARLTEKLRHLRTATDEESEHGE